MESDINVFFAYDSNISVFNDYDLNMGHMYQKKQSDSIFMLCIIKLLRKKIKSFNFFVAAQQNNILRDNILVTQDNQYDYLIQNNLLNNILYYPIDVQNQNRTNLMLNKFLDTNGAIFDSIDAFLWNAKSFSKNIILYYSETHEILYNEEILINEKKKKIDDFCNASVAYIIKSYNSYNFIFFNNQTMYFSAPVSIFNSEAVIEIEIDKIISILFDDIDEKMKFCEI